MAMNMHKTLVVALAATAIGFFAGQWSSEVWSERSQQKIEINADALAAQIAHQSSMLGRKLTPQELESVTQKQIALEVMVREAALREVHLHDADIRKHMVSVVQRTMASAIPTPTQSELEAFLKENIERYKTPRAVTFEHVFFLDDQAAASALVADLQNGASLPKKAGDVFWLGNRMERYSYGQLLTVLGHEFVQGIRDLPKGQWTGPIRSGRGWHVVRIEALHEPQQLSSDELQARLRKDWQQQRHSEIFDAQISKMSEPYEIALPARAAVEEALEKQMKKPRSILASITYGDLY